LNYIEKYILGYCRVMLINIFLISAVSSTLFVMFGLLIKGVIDNKESLADSKMLVIFAFCFLAIRFFMPLGYSLCEFLTQRLNIKLSYSLRAKIIDRILTSQNDSFSEKKTGEINKVSESMITSATTLTRTICTDVIPLLIQLATIVVTIAVSVNYIISVEFLVMMLAYLYFVIRMTQRRLPMMRAVAITAKKVSGGMFDLMQLLPVDKSFHTIDKSRSRFMGFVNDNISKQVAVSNEFFFFGISSALLSVLFCGIILFSVYVLIQNGNITSGSLIMVATFLFQIFLPMNQAGFIFRQIKMARADIDLYCTETEDIIPSNSRPSPLPLAQDKTYVRIRNGLFDTTIALKKGDITFLIGPNGSGKSTFGRVLSGNRNSSDTLFEINGRVCDRTELPYPNVLYVPQDIELLPGTVEDNISHFSDRTHLSAITEWLKRFGFDKPLDHVIRGFGSNLSGGEKQKLGVMLSYGRPYSLIVFDEPTKGFDESGVNAFCEYLSNENRDKYVLVITHDKRLLGSCSDTSIVRMNNNKDLACE